MCLLRGMSICLGSISVQSTWHLCWKMWHWDRVFSECFGFPLTVSLLQCSTLSYGHLHVSITRRINGRNLRIFSRSNTPFEIGRHQAEKNHFVFEKLHHLVDHHCVPVHRPQRFLWRWKLESWYSHRVHNWQPTNLHTFVRRLCLWSNYLGWTVHSSLTVKQELHTGVWCT